MKIPEKFTCIIPIRYGSTRFLGKPLFSISGKKMIDWVWQNANSASLVNDVIIAAYDESIVKYCKEHNYKFVHVDQKVKNGSEAVADVAKNIDTEYIFEMQGDQPLVTPDVIDDFIKRATDLIKNNPEIDVVIPYSPADDAATESPNVLKVVKTESGRLVFQSRYPIKTGWRTLGLYLWKTDALRKVWNLPISEVEKAEDSHPIRLYINDFYVQGISIESSDWIEVDREEQIPAVEKLISKKGLK